MLKEHSKIVSTLGLAFDLVLTGLIFWLSLKVSRIPSFQIPDQLKVFTLGNIWLVPVVLLVWGLILSMLGFDRSFRTAPIAREVALIFKSAVYGGIIVLVLLKFTPQFLQGVRLFSVFLPLYFVGMVVSRLAIRASLRQARRRGLNFRGILIVGTRDRAREVAQVVQSNAHWGLKIVGLLTLNLEGQGNPEGQIRHLGSLDDLEKVLTDNVIDDVIFAVYPEELPLIQAALQKCQEAGVRARVRIDLFDYQADKDGVEFLEGYPFLVFGRTPITESQKFVKRIVDAVVSAIILMILSPLFLLIAFLIKASSSGPVFFKQTRCSLQGRRFQMYKFRTMVRDAEKLLDGLKSLNERDGPTFKVRNDPRVTRLGRFLRRWSLDELPQLINVIKGDISLVGPRPPLPSEVELYERWQRRRLSVKPGVTGLWQVKGRGSASFTEAVKLDIEYIDKWSFGLDFKIILLTLKAVLQGEGAY